MLKFWHYYLKLYKKYHYLLGLSILASLIQSICLAPITWLIANIFDQAIPKQNTEILIKNCLLILLLYICNMLLIMWNRYTILKITKTVLQKLRQTLLEKFYNFSRHYYTQTNHSDLHTIIVQDTLRIDVMSNMLVARLIPSLLICIVLSGLLLIINWLLFLVIIAVVPIIYLLGITLGKKVKQKVKKYHEIFAKLNKGMLFVIETLELTIVQGAQNYEMNRQGKLFNDYRIISGDYAFFSAVYSLIQNLISFTTAIILLIVGGIIVSSGGMTLGEILSFYVTVGIMRNYLSVMLEAIPQMIEGNESLKTVYNLLQVQDESHYHGTIKIDFQGKITLKNVQFEYSEINHVLKNINLEINPGETVAIIGENGAGKSTITYLILGFYRPLTGEIFIDNHPLEKLDLNHFRSQIGVVNQEPIIIDGTILDNIIYGQDDVNMETAIAAAKIATADNFIDKLPDGYQTLVGENGVLLSGGQKQRLAIARALFRKPKLLILDEPTNHLDRVSIHQLMQNIKEIEPKPSILIISHDGDIVKQADHVYNLQDGYLTEVKL
jgi:ABC-type bacteriocin/lantibiotic exporter with double-glycine peptidase domain